MRSVEYVFRNLDHAIYVGTLDHIEEDLQRKLNLNLHIGVFRQIGLTTDAISTTMRMRLWKTTTTTV